MSSLSAARSLRRARRPAVSAAFPVTTAQLRDLGALLLDIHGQNDGRHLLDEREHLRSLDKFGQLEPELARYQAQYQAYQALCKERDTLSAYENEKNC